MINRLKRDASECQQRKSIHHILAEIGVSYLAAFLEMEKLEDDMCIQKHICTTARHVASLTDPGGLVEKLNKLIIRATSLHILETRGYDPNLVIEAGDWGRAWQNCQTRYRCI